MSHYHEPFRGLPAEIRLKIWADAQVEKVTVRGLRLLSTPEVQESSSLHVWPKPTHLLLVNSKVYSEALEFVRKVQIKFWGPINYEHEWPKIERAMQSPSLGTLNYRLLSRSGDGMFLLKFMTLPVHRSLEKLILTFEKKDSHTKRLLFRPGDLGSTENFKLKQYHATALFASAYLSKGLVREVQARAEDLPASQLPNWQPVELQNLVLGSNTGDACIQGLRGGTDFLQFIYGSLGPAAPRRIRITADIAKSDSNDDYEGSITYKLA